MSFLDRLRGGGEGAGGDPVRREAERLYALLREEAQPAGALAVSKALPTGQRILKESTPELQAAVLEVACEEILGATQRRFEDGRHYLARDMIQNLVKRKLAAPPHRVAAMLETCSAAGSAYHHWMPALSLLRLVSNLPRPAKSRRSGP